MNFQERLKVFWSDLSHFPWRDTAHTLRARFREDQMGLTAGSLTFTTSIALVPFFTVALAVFTAFPMFSKLQGALQAWPSRSDCDAASKSIARSDAMVVPRTSSQCAW